MNTQPIYTFPGLWPFIEQAGAARDARLLERTRGLWHTKQVQDALGQYPRLDPESRRSVLEHIASVRESLAAALDGIDQAVREVVTVVEAKESFAEAVREANRPKEIPPAAPPTLAGPSQPNSPTSRAHSRRGRS